MTWPMRADKPSRIDTVEERTRSYTWKVVVGTGIGLYLAMTATMVGLS